MANRGDIYVQTFDAESLVLFWSDPCLSVRSRLEVRNLALRRSMLLL